MIIFQQHGFQINLVEDKVIIKEHPSGKHELAKSTKNNILSKTVRYHKFPFPVKYDWMDQT